ncbi:MAG: hypothetical protein KA469_01465, partial [Phycisphaerae bacterium]|nr:hypothetical protein [Phycisphaerae bacterium]
MKSRQGTSQPLQYLPFEEEVARIDQLIAQQGNEDSLHGKNASKIRQLQVRQTELLQKIYSNLSPWQTV